MNDIAEELNILHGLTGVEFVRQLEKITHYGGFSLLKNESNIFVAGGENNEDFSSLMDAARKAVEHGNIVYILPNPRNCRTADFIFEKRGTYKMYDLKTIHGKSSVETRLLASVGQSNRILLNIATDYNGRLLASDIRCYFEMNKNAVEVLLYKGKKEISVNRYTALNSMFFKQFRKRYEK